MNDAIMLDLNLSTLGQVGQGGLSPEDFEGLLPKAKSAHQGIVTARQAGSLAFMDLPGDAPALAAAKELAGRLSTFENLVVLGIGGSLGAEGAVLRAGHPFHNLLPREERRGARGCSFPTTPTPHVRALLEILDLPTDRVRGDHEERRHRRDLGAAARRSASGSGAEASRGTRRRGHRSRRRARCARSRQRRAGGRCPCRRRWAAASRCFTAVGLAPGRGRRHRRRRSCCAGAEAMAGRVRGAAICEEPGVPARLGVLHLMDATRPAIHVLMPYADALRETARLVRAALGGEPGEARPGYDVGPTPLRAVGATDQHSLLQLLMEGPEDKVDRLRRGDSRRQDLSIPSASRTSADVGTWAATASTRCSTPSSRRPRRRWPARAGRRSPSACPRSTPPADGRADDAAGGRHRVRGRAVRHRPLRPAGRRGGESYACGLLGRPATRTPKQELEQRPRRGRVVM